MENRKSRGLIGALLMMALVAIAVQIRHLSANRKDSGRNTDTTESPSAGTRVTRHRPRYLIKNILAARVSRLWPSHSPVVLGTYRQRFWLHRDLVKKGRSTESILTSLFAALMQLPVEPIDGTRRDNGGDGEGDGGMTGQVGDEPTDTPLDSASNDIPSAPKDESETIMNHHDTPAAASNGDQQKEDTKPADSSLNCNGAEPTASVSGGNAPAALQWPEVDHDGPVSGGARMINPDQPMRVPPLPLFGDPQPSVVDVALAKLGINEVGGRTLSGITEVPSTAQVPPGHPEWMVPASVATLEKMAAAAEQNPIVPDAVTN